MQDATRATRCLATLERLTGQELLFKVWPVLLRMGQLVRRFTRGELSPAAMLEFETALQDLARELCRAIMEDSLNRLEPSDYECMPQQLLWEGEYYRKRPKSPLRNLNCLFGSISLQRFCFQRLETCGRCLFPLEIQLGIVAGVATPALADLVARLSVDLTQRQVLEQLLQQEVKWGIRTLRKLTSATAASMAPHRRTAQVQQLLTWLRTAAEQKVSRPFTLSVGRDGVMLPILKSNNYKGSVDGDDLRNRPLWQTPGHGVLGPNARIGPGNTQ